MKTSVVLFIGAYETFLTKTKSLFSQLFFRFPFVSFIVVLKKTEGETMEKIKLNNGVEIPCLGLGVYKTTSKEEMKEAVTSALDAGYRMIDGAQMYNNEDILGDVLQETGFPRKELFLVSKVERGNMSYDKVLSSFEETLKKLKTDYLDMFMIHWAGLQKERFLDTWRGMEKLYKEGRIKVLGVCNCCEKHIRWLLDNAEIKPAINQVERNPWNNEKEIEAFCKKHDIQMEAWAPLLKGNFALPEIVEIAKKVHKTPAQVVLRWDYQSHWIVIPKSVHRERIFENADFFDFTLSNEDMEKISSLSKGYHSSHDPETYDF